MTAPPQELVERALALSSADGCLVIVEEQTDANLRWANNTLTTNGVTRVRTITVISVVGAAAGVVTRQGATPADLASLVTESEATARSAPEAEDRAPLVGDEASSGEWDDPAAETTIGVFGSFAPALGDAFARCSASGRLLYGYANHQVTSTFLGSSTGLRCRFDQPAGHAEINAKSADLTRSSWVGVPSTDFTDVDVEALGADLDRRLAWADRTADLPAGRYDTILPPGAVADLMAYLYWSAGALPAQDGRSVFSRPGGGTLVGERITDVPLTLRSDPAAPGMQCAPFVLAGRSGEQSSVFDNGSPLSPTEWVSDGVVRALVQTRRSAALTGLAYTPYVDNLALQGRAASGDLEEIVAGTERGLLLTCLWYIREVDPQSLLLTGLTRDGVYLVEGGEVTAAVNNFRFNESPLGVLSRASAVGAAERTLPREWCDSFNRVTMPALRVEGFNMSSVSLAS